MVWVFLFCSSLAAAVVLQVLVAEVVQAALFTVLALLLRTERTRLRLVLVVLVVFLLRWVVTEPHHPYLATHQLAVVVVVLVALVVLLLMVALVVLVAVREAMERVALGQLLRATTVAMAQR